MYGVMFVQCRQGHGSGVLSGLLFRDVALANVTFLVLDVSSASNLRFGPSLRFDLHHTILAQQGVPHLYLLFLPALCRCAFFSH